MFPMSRRVVLLGGKTPYYKKVLTIQPANLIAYYRMNEIAGSTAVDSSTQINNGTYVGVDLANAAGPDGVLVPFYDGTSDYLKFYSAGFAADFNGQEGTVACWIKIDDVATWNAAGGRSICILYADASNLLYIEKPVAANQLTYSYTANGTNDYVTITSVSSTSWVHIAMTWSEAADQLKAYWNGSQVGTTQSTLGGAGAWAGAVINNGCLFGASSTVPAKPWKGWLAHATVWNTPLTPAQILALATV